MSTVSSKNIVEIPELIDIYTEHDVDIFSFSRYFPSQGDTTNGISPEEYHEFLLKCDEKFEHYNSLYFEGKGWLLCNKKDHLWTLLDYENGRFKIPENAEKGMIYSGYNCGNCHLTILPTGDFYACRRVVHSKVENAFTDRLSDLWLKEMESYRDYEKFEKCSK